MTWPENPHWGNSGVPFMNNTTGFSEITFSIRSRAFGMAQVLMRAESQGPALFTPCDIARRSVGRQRNHDKKVRRSAARRVHMTLGRRRRRSRDDEIVALGLARNRRPDRLAKRPIRRRAA